MIKLQQEEVTGLWVLERGYRGTLTGAAIGGAIDLAIFAFIKANSFEGLRQ
jgi:hypothetical protein